MIEMRAKKIQFTKPKRAPKKMQNNKGNWEEKQQK